MREMYNKRKLMPSMETMKSKRLLVLGGGAVGSLVVEGETRASMGYIAVADRDRCEEGNIPKSSMLIRYPEDIDKPKATVLAERASAVANEGCAVRGYDIDIKHLGPLAFAGFDYCVAAVDNLAIKLLIAEMITACPVDKRPILLSCGTNGEYSEAMMFADGKACLRCTIPDAWLDEEDPETVYSCAAKVNYLRPDKASAIVSTSGRAGGKCASDICDAIEEHALGHIELRESRRISHMPLDLRVTDIVPMKRCPVCEISPPEPVIVLDGSTPMTTLRTLLEEIGKTYGEPFILRVHSLHIGKHIYNQFVISDRCRACGKTFSVGKHSGWVRTSELMCSDCRKTDNAVPSDKDSTDATEVRFFSLRDTPDSILDMKLFDLGYPIGCYYEAENVINSNDFLNFPESRYFSLREDESFLYT